MSLRDSLVDGGIFRDGWAGRELDRLPEKMVIKLVLTGLIAEEVGLVARSAQAKLELSSGIVDFKDKDSLATGTHQAEIGSLEAVEDFSDAGVLRLEGI